MKNYACISCKLIFEFYDKGFIYVKGEKNERKWTQSIPESIFYEGGCFIPYQSQLDALEKVTIIQRLFNSEDLEATLVDVMKKPMTLSPFQQVAKSMEEYSTVQIIRKTEFISHFQPIVKLDTNQVIAFESLLRDPQQRVSPGDLFEIAQSTGMHSMLDQKARRSAIMSRAEKIPDGIKSFINFLPSTIYNPEYCLQHTFNYIEKYNVLPTDLVFEVVETEKIEDIEHLKEIFRVYKREGMLVALDDFGSGYSTFDVLAELLPDYVKIDRSHIMNCDQSSKKQKYLLDIVHFANNLGITTLAEGIETIEELEVCREMGINLGQGYYLGRPESEPKLRLYSS